MPMINLSRQSWLQHPLTRRGVVMVCALGLGWCAQRAEAAEAVKPTDPSQGVKAVKATPPPQTPQTTPQEAKTIKEETPPEVKRLQAFMDRLKSVEAEFEQRLLDAEAGEPQESRGQFSASRPGKFRWDYSAPYKQVIVSDGRMVWFYEPDLKQVTRSPAGRLEKTPAGFLTSGKKLEEIFTWEVTPSPKAGQMAVLLRPIHEGSIHWIAISLHPQKDEIDDFVVEDSLKHRSRIRFVNWRANGEVPPERFRFDVPKDVDIIENNDKTDKNAH
ncbi:MAG: outer membrane lipoprotein chaperone LolA [Magnetococcales bacterium]|nr:outer membrane lipoprotein chaperone LolA [Magnetococcales bacterium]